MDAIQLLTTRSSAAMLTSPAPSGDDWRIIQQATMRVPDHAGLRPYSFLVFDQPHTLQQLGEIFVKALLAVESNASQEAIERAKMLPQRAPMVVVCVANIKKHPKVPPVEQIISAGCAVMAMQQAAFALGFGGVWKTGSYAYDPVVRSLLGLNTTDEIVGFLYLGTPSEPVVLKETKSTQQHFVSFHMSC